MCNSEREVNPQMTQMSQMNGMINEGPSFVLVGRPQAFVPVWIFICVHLPSICEYHSEAEVHFNEVFLWRFRESICESLCLRAWYVEIVM